MRCAGRPAQCLLLLIATERMTAIGAQRSKGRAAPVPGVAHNRRLPALRFETGPQFSQVGAFDSAQLGRRRKNANSSRSGASSRDRGIVAASTRIAPSDAAPAIGCSPARRRESILRERGDEIGDRCGRPHRDRHIGRGARSVTPSHPAGFLGFGASASVTSGSRVTDRNPLRAAESAASDGVTDARRGETATQRVLESARSTRVLVVGHGWDPSCPALAAQFRKRTRRWPGGARLSASISASGCFSSSDDAGLRADGIVGTPPAWSAADSPKEDPRGGGGPWPSEIACRFSPFASGCLLQD